MIERQKRGNQSVLLHPEFDSAGNSAALDEFRELALTAGADIVTAIRAPRKKPDAKYFVGLGKAEELAATVSELQADLVLVSQPLSAIQQRNLEQLCGCQVLDRTTLILDIFAQRARTFEGKLQVELAQLRHLSTRLVRGWTHLERQKGGIGLRGPGETQLETDRRLIGQRISKLNKRLKKVERQRDQSRRARARSHLPTVALVGYTNAGKSTIFNALTAANVVARDQLFATLDPTVRRLDSVARQPMLLADTVGFIRDLPHELVAAFRSTLQETREADLLVHVIDAADEENIRHHQEVIAVLDQIGAGQVPSIKVYNKIDLTGQNAGISKNADGRSVAVHLSAKTGVGLEDLVEVLADCFAEQRICTWIRVAGADGRIRAHLFQLGAVEQEHTDADGGWEIKVNISPRDAQSLSRLGGKNALQIQQQLLAVRPLEA